MSKRSLTKSGRLLVLLRLRDQGLLEEMTLQEVGDALGLNRSTILRDIRELDAIEAEYQRIMAIQPWLRRFYSTSEFAEEIGASAETVRRMCQDGLVKYERDGSGYYRIPVSEVDRFRRED